MQNVLRKKDLPFLLFTAMTVSLFCALLLSGCTPTFQWPAELKVEEARRRAIADFSAGDAVIIKIGSGNCWEPGVTPLDKETVRWLPRETSRCQLRSSGHLLPDLSGLEKYAYAYNKQIIELKRQQE